MQKIKIDIISDVIWWAILLVILSLRLTFYSPWCYIGQRKLNKAIERYKDKAQFEVTWHPYTLDPSLPKEGEHAFLLTTRAHHLTSKKVKIRWNIGTRNSARKVQTHLSLLQTEQVSPHDDLQRCSNDCTGESVGIHFKYGGDVANTLRPHKLAHFAKEKGKQDQVTCTTRNYSEISLKLYRSWPKCLLIITRKRETLVILMWASDFWRLFCMFYNVVDTHPLQILSQAAARCGLDQQEVKNYLNSDTDEAVVDEEIQTVRKKYGATGVPFFVVGEKYAVSGAREAETFEMMFDKLLK